MLDLTQLMSAAVLVSKQNIENIISEAQGFPMDEKNSAEFCQTFLFICLGLEKHLPEDFQKLLVPNLQGLMSDKIDYTKKTFAFIGNHLGESDVPTSEILKRTLILLTNAFKDIYPHAELLIDVNKISPLVTASDKEESESYDAKIDPVHQGLVEAIFQLFKENFPKIGQTQLGWTMSEQLTADMCQTLFYIPLDLDKLLPAQHQWLIPDFKVIMKTQIEITFNTLFSHISPSLIKRGYNVEEIMVYILTMVRISYSRNFPNSTLMGLKK